MNRNLCIAAFLSGLVTVGWVGLGYVGSNPLALIMTIAIGAIYWMGSLEMHRFRQASLSLARVLDAIPHNLTNLGDWLDKVPPSLQNPVRLRIEGERIGLPGPALTPFLVGLLVMMGMLGTFLGMVVTLNGAVFALEGTTDLQTMRSSLSAPIRGLGLAFGTSVAGVASSAMLGLISVLCRRERLQIAQMLDMAIATKLRGFSLAHQRTEAFKALQLQAKTLPNVIDKLQAMMATMERQNQQLNERMVGNQESFHREVKGVYSDLATAVDQSLKTSLNDSVAAAGNAMKPMVEAAIQGIERATESLHERMSDTVALQLDGISARFGSTVSTVESTWTAALATHERTSENVSNGLQKSLTAFTETFEQRSSILVGTLQADLDRRDQQRLAATAQSMESMAASLQREWQQAGAHTLAQQQKICETMERTTRDITAQAQIHASKTISEIGRLMEAAAEAPRAAAEVIGQLRHEISNSMARDNVLLEERGRIMEALNTLLAAMNQGSAEQQAAIDSLVSSSTTLLDRLSGQLTESIGAESARIADAADQVTGSAVEVSSLSDAFGFAVRQFSDANEKMITNLQRIESTLEKSMARSDEQLAYYVAQAREIIDLSIMSQKQTVDDLHRLAGRQSIPTSEAI